MVKGPDLIQVRQRAGTASGIVFITLEDETGIANLVVFQKIFTEYRKEILQAHLLMVEGQLQIEGEVIHVIARRCHNVSKLLNSLSISPEQTPALLTLLRADEQEVDNYTTMDKRVQKNLSPTEVFHAGRNFK